MKAFLVLLLVAVPAYFVALGANSIWDANEAFYVETPRQMIRSGDYINPTFNAQPRQNKPVLSYWIVAGFYRLFGESVAVERVAIAIGGVGVLFATFLLGRALGSRDTGVLAALLMATAPRVLFFSRRIFIDVYIALFMSLALACFALALRQPARRRRYLAAMYVCMGLGFLTKGPIAVALPAIVAALWLIAERRLADLRRLMIVPGVLLVVAIAAPWWAALYADRGWQPIYDFFITENVGRYSSAMTTDRRIWFYLPTLLVDILLPWAPLLLLPLLSYWRRRLTSFDEKTAPIGRLLWWWIVAIVLFFSLAASKEDLYIYPVMPAAAALIAHELIATDFGDFRRGIRWTLAAIGVGCVLLAGGVQWLLGSGYYQIAGARSISTVLAAGGGVAAFLALRRQGRAAVVALAAAFVALNYLLVARVLPDLERFKPVPPLARTILERASPGARIASCNLDLPSFVYYLDRPVTALDCVSSLAHPVEFYRQYPETWIITSGAEWNELRDRLPGACVATSKPLFDVTIGNLLRRQPPKDVILITNKCG